VRAEATDALVPASELAEAVLAPPKWNASIHVAHAEAVPELNEPATTTDHASRREPPRVLE